MHRLTKYQEQTYALLRIMAGWMFAFHGTQIIFRVYAEGYPPSPAWSQSWFGGWIELVGGILVCLGLRTRAAAFLCSGTMAVAYFQFHWKFQTGRMFWPTLNQGEMAVLYCFIFLVIACRGGVRWSLDKR